MEIKETREIREKRDSYLQIPNSERPTPKVQLPTSKSSEVKDLFNRIAPVYDRLNYWLSLGQHRIWKLMTVKWCEPKVGDKGLDLCCGSGDLAQLLAQKVGQSGTVIGVDFSAAQLATARSRTSSQFPHLSLSWVEADVLHLPFEDNTFHCATMGYGLRNVSDIRPCLQELHRVLKPDAKAAILDFHRPYNRLLRSFQQWYLETLVVPVAQQFGLTEEYAYIAPSLDRFPQGKEQVQLSLEAGFKNATHYPIAEGMMGVLVLQKR